MQPERFGLPKRNLRGFADGKYWWVVTVNLEKGYERGYERGLREGHTKTFSNFFLASRLRDLPKPAR